MPDHPTEEQIRGFLRGSVEPAEMLSIDDHVSGCPQCTSQVAALYSLDGAYERARVAVDAADLSETQHPFLDVIDADLEGRLTAQESQELRSHLESCPECSRAAAAESRSPVRAFPERGEESSVLRSRRFRPVLRPRPLMTLAASSIAFVIAAAGAVALVAQQKELRALRRQTADIEARLKANDDESARSRELQSSLAQLEEEMKNIAAYPAPENTQLATPVTLRDGAGPVGLDSAGRLTGLGSLPLRDQALVKNALLTGILRLPAVVQKLSWPKQTLMGQQGGPGGPTAMSPVGTVVESGRVRFRWTGIPGARKYVVRVFDKNFGPVSETIAQGSESHPAPTEADLDKELASGREYLWQVEAVCSGASSGALSRPAKFEVLDESRAAYLRSVAATHPGSHLLLGILYAREGLLDDASGEFEKLASLNPGSPLPRKMIASLRRPRRGDQKSP